MDMLSILMIVALLSVLGSLAFGLFSMFKGGDFDKKHSNQAMRWRILLQSLALIIFFILLWSKGHSWYS